MLNLLQNSAKATVLEMQEMSVTFENPPLVELVAEVRWEPQSPAINFPAGAAFASLVISSPELEAFYANFGIEMDKHGFSRQERIVPSQIPMAKHQAVWRFKRHGRENELIQVGPGVFTANALPPYKHWSEFRPVVEKGLGALLSTRAESEKGLGCTVVFHYIDAFQSDLVGGKGPKAFLEEVLGFEIKIPASLSKMLEDGQTFKPRLQLQLPLKNKLQMAIVLGEGGVRASDGQIHVSDAVVMNTTVTTQELIQPDLPTLMAALDASQSAIHDFFIEATKPIHLLMNTKASQ